MEFYFTLGIFAFMMFAMAIGVILSGRTLKGSCGGVGGNCPCDEAGTPGACKVELDGTTQTDQSSVIQHVHTQQDGVMLYGTKES